MVCDCRPLKEEMHCVRITVDRDRLTYNDDASSPATDMLETKTLFNSIMFNARKGARFMTLDIKDYFLATPMRDPEHVWVQLKHMPEDIRKRHGMMNIVTKDEWACIKI